MTKILIPSCLFAVLFGLPHSASTQEGPRPNFLIILADDCTYNDLPIYGGRNARTPNIDRLAQEGLVFRQAYLCEAMCQPCRSELYTGQYPFRNGSAWNHSCSRPETTSLPQHLGQLGYRVGLAGKVHVKPAKAFPFEEITGFDTNCVRSSTQPHSTTNVAQFMQRDDQQPFCLVIALVEPHVPWVMGNAAPYREKLVLPPYIVDTPRTRDAFARYLAEITFMDGQVGQILAVLDETGKARNTLVLFTSEQGSQFPGCKWTNWNNGLHTALVARWPTVIEPSQGTDAVVQYADVAPTLVEIAGGNVSEFHYDGTSFLSTLRTPEKPHRRYAYGIHNNVPEGPAYPIRSISNGEFRYIRNLLPDEIYIEKHLMGISGDGLLNNPYWSSWVFKSGDSERAEWLVKRYMKRPAEQLYHTSADPHELINLAGNPDYAGLLAELSRELDQWLHQQGDPGVPLDTVQALEAARKGDHTF